MKNVRVRVTSVGGPGILRTIHQDTSLGASLKGLIPAEDLRQMLPPGSNVEINFLNHGEVHLRSEGPVDAVLGSNKMIPGETHVLRRDEVQVLSIGNRLLKLHVFSSHF